MAKITTTVAATVTEALKSATGKGEVTAAGKQNPLADPRCPARGTVIRKTFRGGVVKVKVVKTGFLHDGTTYSSLSKLGTKLAGCATNGWKFFNLLTPVVGATAGVEAGEPKAKKTKKVAEVV